jgi:hypothetical protein
MGELAYTGSQRNQFVTSHLQFVVKARLFISAASNKANRWQRTVHKQKSLQQRVIQGLAQHCRLTYAHLSPFA